MKYLNECFCTNIFGLLGQILAIVVTELIGMNFTYF